MDMNVEDIEKRKYQVNRRTLRFLLVLSFINTGQFLLYELAMGAAKDFFLGYTEGSIELIKDNLDVYKGSMAEFMASSTDTMAMMLERIQPVPQWYFVLCALLDIASVVGLVLMWRLRKNGFHCYALSKLILMLMPMMFLSRSYVGIGDMMIGILCIVYYFFLMRALGTFDGGKVVSVSESDESVKSDVSDDSPSPENE